MTVTLPHVPGAAPHGASSACVLCPRSGQWKAEGTPERQLRPSRQAVVPGVPPLQGAGRWGQDGLHRGFPSWARVTFGLELFVVGTVGTARVLCPRDCLASPPPTPHTAAGHGRDAARFCTHRSVGGRGLGAWPGVSSHAAGLQGRASPCACRLGGRRAARHLVPQGRPACASGGEPLCPGPWGPSPTRRPGQRPAGSSACHTSWQRLGCEPTPRTAPGLPTVDPRPGSCPGELRPGARALLTRRPVQRA